MCGWFRLRWPAPRARSARAAVNRRPDRRQDLHGHRAIEPRIARAIDLAHAARAEGRLNLVGAEPCASTERKSKHEDYSGADTEDRPQATWKRGSRPLAVGSRRHEPRRPRDYLEPDRGHDVPGFRPMGETADGRHPRTADGSPTSPPRRRKRLTVSPTSRASGNWASRSATRPISPPISRQPTSSPGRASSRRSASKTSARMIRRSPAAFPEARVTSRAAGCRKSSRRRRSS